ncbi:hypothetical protein Droror1_Dr00022385 [Drosera rotundifolia]
MTTEATMATSFLNNDLEGEERGMMREEMLAGKEVNEGGGGSGGKGLSGSAAAACPKWLIQSQFRSLPLATSLAS